MKKVAESSPDLSPLARIGKDEDLPDNGGYYKFEVNAEYTGDKHAIRLEVLVTTGLEKTKMVRIISNETRMSGIEDLKTFCSDALHYIVAAMFTSFPAPDQAQLMFEDDDLV